MGLTIIDIIDQIVNKIPCERIADTVDTIKTGNPKQQITGIVTTFLATYEVINSAIKMGANLIITHEPTFYSHEDDTVWLDNNPVYRAKRDLIEEHEIVIWRFHDYMHKLHPGGILTGMLKELEWEGYSIPETPHLCDMPVLTLKELGDYIKNKLQIDSIRIIGDLNMRCRRIGLAVGASGGKFQINRIANTDIDVLICGEINEWETSEYVRDSISLGHNKALIVIGHAPSEEAGMKHLVEWLQSHFPLIKIDFIPTRYPFIWI